MRPHGSQSEDRSAVPTVPAVRIACRLAGLLLTFAAHAAAPVLDTLFPAAVQLGTTHAVVAVGKAEPWPPKVWVDAPGIRFEPTTNSGTFSVVIAPDAPVGPHLVRVFNDDGASAPRFLVVTRRRPPRSSRTTTSPSRSRSRRSPHPSTAGWRRAATSIRSP